MDWHIDEDSKFLYRKLLLLLLLLPFLALIYFAVNHVLDWWSYRHGEGDLPERRYKALVLELRGSEEHRLRLAPELARQILPRLLAMGDFHTQREEVRFGAYEQALALGALRFDTPEQAIALHRYNPYWKPLSTVYVPATLETPLESAALTIVQRCWPIKEDLTGFRECVFGDERLAADNRVQWLNYQSLSHQDPRIQNYLRNAGRHLAAKLRTMLDAGRCTAHGTHDCVVLVYAAATLDGEHASIPGYADRHAKTLAQKYPDNTVGDKRLALALARVYYGEARGEKLEAGRRDRLYDQILDDLALWSAQDGASREGFRARGQDPWTKLQKGRAPLLAALAKRDSLRADFATSCRERRAQLSAFVRTNICAGSAEEPPRTEPVSERGNRPIFQASQASATMASL